MLSLSCRLSLLCVAGLVGAGTAHAQITTNAQALDSLAGARPEAGATQAGQSVTQHIRTQRHVAPRPAQRPQAQTTTTPKTTQQAAASGTPATQTTQPPQAPATTTTVAQPAAPAPAPAPAPAGGANQAPGQTPVAAPVPVRPPPAATIPDAPPAVPQLTPPPSEVEVHPFPIPPQPTVQVQAKGTLTPIPGGIRLTFAPGSADLNPETHQAILAFGQNLAYKPHVRALVNAYSSGTADDPSLPRRMALTRGLVARSVLMNGGTPSTRIYVRVIGQPKDAKPGTSEDYLDIYQSDAEP
ncbi:OmpA family protein [Acetobacter lambici]|nr:OmpA family protein [Acetobacter lambici]